MILVRTELQCEAGGAQAMVDNFKAMTGAFEGQDVIKSSRILTDLSGTFDTVVVESEIESIDAYFALLQAAFANQDSQANVGANAYRTGTRTFYTVEATLGSD